MVDVSVIWSVYNRSQYVERSLALLERQTLSRERWEIIFVDDGSSEDYRQILKPWRERFNIQYLKIDTMRHPVVQALNPHGRALIPPHDEPLRFHTPALSHNIAFRYARSDLLFITQPDILQAEQNLEHALRCRGNRAQHYGTILMSRAGFRDQVLAQDLDQLRGRPFKNLFAEAERLDAWRFGVGECYWFILALDRAAVTEIGGVDEDYMGGVFAEDDNFRVRCEMAGWPTKHVPEIQGIHIDHSQLNGRYDRNGERWRWGSRRNRSKWRTWLNDPNRTAIANTQRTWGDTCHVVCHDVWNL